jgi:D-aminopeptidase
VVELDRKQYVVGTLVQTNFLGSLVVCGVPVGDELFRLRELNERREEGSLMVITATDCPLDSRQLKRIARRGALGMARTGAKGGHSSGDYFLAFSTSYRSQADPEEAAFVSSILLAEDSHLTPFLVAAAEAVEEAILNSLLKAVTVEGRDGNRSNALDLDELLLVLRRYGRLV